MTVRTSASAVRQPFRFGLDLHSGVPVYRQLIDQVRGGIAAGSLGAGAHLLRLSGEGSVPAGIYWLRLIQSGRSLLARGAVVR